MSPGHLIREMLVRLNKLGQQYGMETHATLLADFQAYCILQSATSSHYTELGLRAQAGANVNDEVE